MNHHIISFYLSVMLYKVIVGPNIVKSYYVTVNIDRKAKDSDRTYMITNKKTQELCPEGYSKYVAERPDCFSVGSVKYGDESIMIGNSNIKLHYVYAIESYWKYNTPIMVRFVKYHGWFTRVYPAYVLTKSGKWKEENTYYYDKELTKGNLRIVLDDVCADAKEIIEKEKNKDMNFNKEDSQTTERKFKLFEGDKLKKKKSGFNTHYLSFTFFLTVVLYTFLSS